MNHHRAGSCFAAYQRRGKPFALGNGCFLIQRFRQNAGRQLAARPMFAVDCPAAAVQVNERDIVCRDRVGDDVQGLIEKRLRFFMPATKPKQVARRPLGLSSLP